MRLGPSVLNLSIGLILLTQATAGYSQATSRHRAPATGRHLVDVSQFDVAGFRIGMTFADMIAVMNQKYNAQESRITSCISNSCWSGGVSLDNEVDVNNLTQSCADSENGYDKYTNFNFWTDDIKVSMEFVRDFRHPDAKCRIFEIDSYRTGGFIEERDAATFRSAVVAKYGPFTSGSNTSYSWCAKIDASRSWSKSTDSCDENLPYLTVEISSGSGDGDNWQTAVHISEGDVVAPLRDAWKLKTTPRPATNF